MGEALVYPRTDDGMAALLDECDGWVISQGVADMEGADKLTLTVGRNLGAGAQPDGVRVVDCVGGAEKTKALGQCVDTLFALDEDLKWVRNHEDDADESERRSRIAIRNMIAHVVDGAARRLAAIDIAAERRAHPTAPQIVISSTDEDLAHSVSFDVKDQTQAVGVLRTMANYKMRDEFLPLLKVVRKVAYAAKQENATPDPQRLSLECFKRFESDTPIVMFERMLDSVLLVFAGEKVDESKGTYDGGAGDMPNYPRQMLSANVVRDVKDELKIRTPALVYSEQYSFAKLAYETMRTATFVAKESPSRSARGIIVRMPDWISIVTSGRANGGSAKGEAKRGAKEAPSGPASPTKKSKKPAGGGGGSASKPRGGEHARARASTTCTRACACAHRPPPSGREPDVCTVAERAGGGSSSAPAKSRSPKFADVAGAEGPNKLPRMAGGNPAGGKCKYIEKGEACPFKTCSYSHA